MPSKNVSNAASIAVTTSLALFSVAAFADDPPARADGRGPSQRRTPVVAAVERVGPAVVNIATEKIVERRVPSWFSWEPQYLKALSLGSGVFIDPRGYVLTNAHVITQANQMEVHLRDGKHIPARLVAVDVSEDTAIIRVDGNSRYPFVALGRSDDLLIGETVIALGNPFGLENSVSTGVVSAKNRTVEAEGRPVFQDMIQTDALINPGNSGGPLLNIDGDLIGINTAIRQGAQGIGFAVPADKVMDTLLRITTPDRVGHTSFGMRLHRAPRNDKALAVVAGVDPRGPAATGGLREGDRILAASVGQDRADDGDALALNLWLIERQRDERIAFRVGRGGEVVDATVRVGRSPGPPWYRFGIDFGTEGDDRSAPPRLAAIERNGPADEAQLQEGDVLFNVGGVDVKTTGEVEDLLPQIESGQILELGFRRGRRQQYVTRLQVR
ncbi:MAG: trypsin-like peptidase domain-containing protein [Planctomycetes bacterium]|nr:trypsin-like peptidase domain-containing protein [Planctomycetota bacterium]MBI3845796.1 trypsin-like peptidase domain-containing protein [Planctomycetota bacterium]